MTELILHQNSVRPIILLFSRQSSDPSMVRMLCVEKVNCLIRRSKVESDNDRYVLYSLDRSYSGAYLGPSNRQRREGWFFSPHQRYLQRDVSLSAPWLAPTLEWSPHCA